MSTNIKEADLPDQKRLDEIDTLFDQHKGEFVISSDNRIYQFIGIGYDEEDVWYIFYNGKNIDYHSFVLDPIFLKGQLGDKDYNRLRDGANMNYPTAKSVDTYRDARAKIIQSISVKLLTDVCFDN